MIGTFTEIFIDYLFLPVFYILFFLAAFFYIRVCTKYKTIFPLRVNSKDEKKKVKMLYLGAAVCCIAGAVLVLLSMLNSLLS